MKKLAGAAIFAALFLGAFLIGPKANGDVDTAAAAFKAKCAGCHGPDGKGKPELQTPDLSSDEVQKKSDSDLAAVITKGKGKMPAYKNMTPDQVNDMVAFIRSLKR
jgi:cytochrome c oxidase cbb3-type subunit III